jgi:BTB/POZ domain
MSYGEGYGNRSFTSTALRVQCRKKTSNFVIITEFPKEINTKLVSTTGRSSQVKLSSSGALVLDVTVSIIYEGIFAPRSSLYNLGAVYKRIIDNNLNILDNSVFSDFKFIVKGKEFKVHKAILAEFGLEFSKAFEANSNEQKIEEIEPGIFEIMLRFIYGGKLPNNMDEISIKLYEAEHRYGIDSLMEICERQILMNVTSENAITLYSWAWKYNVENLKTDAWVVIKR